MNDNAVSQQHDPPHPIEHLHKSSSNLGTYNEKWMHQRWSWWPSLVRLSRSRAIRGFGAFLVVVPFIVGIVHPIPQTILQAPLSWALGYTAGIFFLVAMILVYIWCPEVADPSRTFAEFRHEGRTAQYILQEAREVYIGYVHTPKRANHFLRGLLGSDTYVTNAGELRPRLPGDNDETLMDRRSVWTLVQQADFCPDRLDESFWYIKWFAEATHQYKRACCWVFFAAGFFFAISLLGAQVIKVMSYYL